MTSEHFTRDDFTGIIAAIFLFAPLLLTPGLVLGWLLDILQFRRQPVIWRLLLSVPLSISVFPILNFLIGSYVSMTAVWCLYVALAVGFAAILLFERRERTQESRPPRWLIWAPLAWAATIVLWGVDIQWGDRLYPSLLLYDFNIRAAFIDSITRLGLPAQNPFFYPGHFVPLRYHYFWFINCSLVDQLGGTLVSPRHALIASDVWAGWGVMAVIALYLRFLHPGGRRAIWQRVAWGIALCTIGGLDIIPNLLIDSLYWITKSTWTPASLEWWNDQVTPFATATIWVAHHVASLLAALTGFLIIFRMPKRKSVKHVLQLACAGLAFASSVGLSIYVSLVFAAFLTLWILFLASRRDFAATGWLGAVGLLAGLCSLPYLSILLTAGGTNGHFLGLTVKSFFPTIVFLPTFGYTWNQIAAANFLLLPLNYFLETGVWVILAVMVAQRFWRRWRKLSRAEWAAALMFATSLLMSTFLRSGVINNNDLAWRGILLAQFVLLIWSVDLLRAWWRIRHRAAPLTTWANSPAMTRWCRRILVLTCLGAISVGVDFCLIRTDLFLDDLSLMGRAQWLDPREYGAVERGVSHIGLRTFAMRQIYSKLDQRLAPEANVQGHPNLWNDVYHGSYLSRQDVSFDFTCGTVFGGNPKDCERLQAELKPLFNDPTAANQLSIDELCAERNIDVLVVNDIDPVFREKSSWVWRRTPILSNAMARAFTCGTPNRVNEVSRGPGHKSGLN